MKKNLRHLFLLCVAITLSFNTFAQSNISFGLTGAGIDLGNHKNSAIYKTCPSENSRFILEPGVRLAAEGYATPATSFKFVQTFRLDAMQLFAASTQIMIRFRLFKMYKHSLSFGFGPSAFYRWTWTKIEGYQDEYLYKISNSNRFQTRINWVSAELEYNYEISKYNDFSFCINHLNPETASFAIGFKHWFSRKSSHCNTCPSFK